MHGKCYTVMKGELARRRETVMRVAFLGVVMLIVLLFATPMQAASHQTLTLGDVKDAIVKKRAEWTANETSVWNLSWELKQHLANAKVRSASTLSKAYNVQVDPSPPAQFDWRSTSGGRDFTTPIRDQGACGSCYIFGSVAVVESLLRMRQGWETSQPNLSEQYALSDCPSCGSCDGGYADRVFGFMQWKGMPLESCFRYMADSNIAATAACDITAKIGGWGFVPLTNADVKAYLLAYGPLASYLDVYEDFFAYSGGVYQHVAGDYVGGHFVAIVGYDDAGGYWIAKNSWGTGWGEQGWFRIAYGDSGIGGVEVLYGTMAGSTPGLISGFSVTITTANPRTTMTNSTDRRVH